MTQRPPRPIQVSLAPNAKPDRALAVLAAWKRLMELYPEGLVTVAMAGQMLGISRQATWDRINGGKLTMVTLPGVECRQQALVPVRQIAALWDRQLISEVLFPKATIEPQVKVKKTPGNGRSLTRQRQSRQYAGSHPE